MLGRERSHPLRAWIIHEAGHTIKGFIGTAKIRAGPAGLWGSASLESPQPHPSFQGEMKQS